MCLTTIGLDVGDDWIGIKNVELDELVIRGDEPAIWGCELLSKLVKQSTKGDLRFFLRPWSTLLWKASYIIQFSLDHPGPTLISHPCLYLSARPINHFFNLLWVAPTKVILFKGHFPINAAKSSTVGI